MIMEEEIVEYEFKSVVSSLVGQKVLMKIVNKEVWTQVGGRVFMQNYFNEQILPYKDLMY